MIISHLACHTVSLLACCLTCCSWYITAAPHFHHTLVTPYICGSSKCWWPDSIRNMHKLGLFPLVKRFQVRGFQTPFSPRLFNCRILRQFSSLTNVQELRIGDLDIPGFMPEIRRYFNHFSPTVRSLGLDAPRGSRQQIICFIGLFPHLEDLGLWNGCSKLQGEPLGDPMLVPFFTPPLRGRLKMRNFKSVGILEDMISLFGGIQFRHMDLKGIYGVQLLLEACAETLETLRFCPSNPYGERISLEGVPDIYEQKFLSQIL